MGDENAQEEESASPEGSKVVFPNRKDLPLVDPVYGSKNVLFSPDPTSCETQKQGPKVFAAYYEEQMLTETFRNPMQPPSTTPMQQESKATMDLKVGTWYYESTFLYCMVVR